MQNGARVSAAGTEARLRDSGYDARHSEARRLHRLNALRMERARDHLDNGALDIRSRYARIRSAN